MGEQHATDAARRHRRARPERHPVGDTEAHRVEAELRTTHALAALDPGLWTVITDLQWPTRRYADVDHVVVGPSGVFVIDTKMWNGDVSVYGDRLRYAGHPEDSVVASLVEAAAAVALLTPGVPQRLVKPVLCAAEAEDLDAHVGVLLVCSSDTLVSALENRVQSMSHHQITVASGQLRDHLHDRGVLKVATRAGRSEAKNARRRDLTPMRGVPIIRIAIAVWFAATLILAPHVLSDTYDTIRDTVEEQIAQR